VGFCVGTPLTGVAPQKAGRVAIEPAESARILLGLAHGLTTRRSKPAEFAKSISCVHGREGASRRIWTRRALTCRGGGKHEARFPQRLALYGSLGWTFRQRQRRQRIPVRSRFTDLVGFRKRILMVFRALPASGVSGEDRSPSGNVGRPEERRTPEAGNVAGMLGVTPSRSDRRFGLPAGRQARTPFLPWRNWPPAATRLTGQPCPNRARPTGERNALSLTYYPQPDRLEALHETKKGNQLPGCPCAVWLGLALALWSWTLA
jgi:hypothetical protein